MNKTQKITIIVSVLAAVVIIFGALVVSKQSKPKPTTTPPHTVTKSELAKSNGKNGNKCFVAVDGTVYEIGDFSLWQNGEHTPSEGQAYCGADMSKVIDKSPHGRSVLKLLTKIGPLKN